MRRLATGGKHRPGDRLSGSREERHKAHPFARPAAAIAAGRLQPLRRSLLMSTRVDGRSAPSSSHRDELVADPSGFQAGSDWRIGTEHEKFGFHRKRHAPAPTRASAASAPCSGSGRSLRVGPGHRPRQPHRACAAGLPKGGLGQPRTRRAVRIVRRAARRVHETDEELPTICARCARWGRARPRLPRARLPSAATRAEMPWMPKGRYEIMAHYMPRVGSAST